MNLDIQKDLPPICCSYQQVFGMENDMTFIQIDSWEPLVQFFVGLNGSGKSKTALAIKRQLQQLDQNLNVRYLRSDRLLSFYYIGHYGGNFFGPSGDSKGLPLDPEGMNAGRMLNESHGMASDAFYILRENPELRLKITALIRKVYGRDLRLPEITGLLDPRIVLDGAEYSLLRDEGHGLQELLVLLASIYLKEWDLLIIDEPELHLHPAASALLINELREECERSGRRAIVVTHEPRLIKPQKIADLTAIWMFRPAIRPSKVSASVIEQQQQTIESDFAQNPDLLADLVFSPKPVLVEGARDVVALTAAISRLVPRISSIQTDFVRCGGNGGVARWFEIARKLHVPVLAIADLDVLFEKEFSRTLDDSPIVKEAYFKQWQCEKTSDVLKPVYEAMRSDNVPTNNANRREWLSKVLTSSDEKFFAHIRLRVNIVLTIWQEAGVWLHPSGDLEGAMEFASKQDPLNYQRKAATISTELDKVAKWASEEMDVTSEIERLLQFEVERIAQEIQRAQGLDQSLQTILPLGSCALWDNSLVEIIPLGNADHKIVVKKPSIFAGWSVEFSRRTSPEELKLVPPIEEKNC
jgi:AAA domain, putative AbiEii toxin, Type IV TA system